MREFERLDTLFLNELGTTVGRPSGRQWWSRTGSVALPSLVFGQAIDGVRSCGVLYILIGLSHLKAST
jgi:hypothetical protein